MAKRKNSSATTSQGVRNLNTAADRKKRFRENPPTCPPHCAEDFWEDATGEDRGKTMVLRCTACFAILDTREIR